MSLISGVPVSAISSGRAMRARMRSESCEHVLRALRGLVLDEVRLVDDHAAEAEVAEPADVPVEHLVVDDDDVGEAVDRVAVAVDHGGRALRGPEAGLARPVGLDDVRARPRAAGRRWPPGRRAAPGRSCRGRARRRAGRCGGPPRRRRPPAPGAASARRPPGACERGRLGQVHAGRAPLPPYSKDRNSGPSSSQVASRRGPGLRCSAAEKSGARNGLASWREITDCGTTRRSCGRTRRRLGGRGLLGGASTPAASSISRLSDLAESETLGVLGEQREQRGVAGGGLGEDRRDAVEALELLGAAGPR